jgi:hypothetical protein
MARLARAIGRARPETSGAAKGGRLGYRRLRAKGNGLSTFVGGRFVIQAWIRQARLELWSGDLIDPGRRSLFPAFRGS